MKQLEIKRYIDVFIVAVSINLKKLKYFKGNFAFELISNIIHIFIMLIFWDSLIKNNYFIPGWNWGQLVIFTAFSELFYGMKFAFTAAGSRFWELIVIGRLDTYLVRPIDARFNFIVKNLKLEQLIKVLPGFVILVLISGIKIRLVPFLIGVLICMIAVVLLTLLELCIGYSSFKLGRVEAIVEFIDALMQFNNYPLTILGNVTKTIFTVAIPFMFFSTIPTQLVTDMLGIKELAFVIVSLIFVITLWVIIDRVLWRKGVDNYESYNG